MKKPLADYHPGSVVFMADRMGDEIRETFMIRDPERECRYSYNVPVGYFGLVQGDPASPKPRVAMVRKEASRDPGEADGRTPCYPVSQSTFYPLFFDEAEAIASSIRSLKKETGE